MIGTGRWLNTGQGLACVRVEIHERISCGGAGSAVVGAAIETMVSETKNP